MKNSTATVCRKDEQCFSIQMLRYQGTLRLERRTRGDILTGKRGGMGENSYQSVACAGVRESKTTDNRPLFAINTVAFFSRRAPRLSPCPSYLPPPRQSATDHALRINIPRDVILVVLAVCWGKSEAVEGTVSRHCHRRPGMSVGAMVINSAGINREKSELASIY